MINRYFGKVVRVIDKFQVVIDKGHDQGVVIGSKFLIVGIGEPIVDPDTGNELEKLEIVRGKASATHVQNKIATLESMNFEWPREKREIKRVNHTRGGGLASLLPPQEVITELVTPSEPIPIGFKAVEVGDWVIKC